MKPPSTFSKFAMVLTVFASLAYGVYGYVWFQAANLEADATDSDTGSPGREASRPQYLAWLLGRWYAFDVPRAFRTERTDEYRMSIGKELTIMFYPDLTGEQRFALQELAKDSRGGTTQYLSHQRAIASSLNYYRLHEWQPKMGWTQKWQDQQLTR